MNFCINRFFVNKMGLKRFYKILHSFNFESSLGKIKNFNKYFNAFLHSFKMCNSWKTFFFKCQIFRQASLYLFRVIFIYFCDVLFISNMNSFLIKIKIKSFRSFWAFYFFPLFSTRKFIEIFSLENIFFFWVFFWGFFFYQDQLKQHWRIFVVLCKEV